MSSEYFERAFTDSGSIRVLCDFCGREHFANDERAGDWEEEELEELRKRAREEPEKCMGWDYDSISWGYLAGQRYVPGCPCEPEKAEKYENFIWENRHQISRYLKERTKSIAMAAALDEEMMGDMK